MNESIDHIHCVILAAGLSSRLRPLTDELPKCLLEVQGKSILQRIIENLFASGIHRIGIVTGFKSAAIRNHLQLHFPHHRFRYIYNPNYESTNNAYSLLLSKKFVEDQDGNFTNDLLLLDSDLLFGNRLLQNFFQKRAADGIAVRSLGEHNEEEIGVRTNSSGNVVALGKNLSDSAGESIGIELFSPATAARLYEILEQRIRSGGGRTEYYESAFQQMIDEGSVFTAVAVGDDPVMEIDTLEDLQQAQHLLLES